MSHISEGDEICFRCRQLYSFALEQARQQYAQHRLWAEQLMAMGSAPNVVILHQAEMRLANSRILFYEDKLENDECDCQ